MEGFRAKCPTFGCPNWRHIFYAVSHACQKLGLGHDFRFARLFCRRCRCSYADSLDRLGCFPRPPVGPFETEPRERT